ncbi:MAG TPA: DeoR/GlpR family DNA-binding transcription regulator [Symbiobacteriaceae bacterium]
MSGEKPMFPEQRLNELLALLRERGVVRIAEMARHFSVSRETIRRDLAELEERGLVRKVHGGAVLAGPRSQEPPYATRMVSMVEEKRRIGEAAAALVRDGESLLLDLGTTTLEVARHLRGRRGLTVITNSVPAALTLVEEPGVEVFLTGGRLRGGDHSLSGSWALRSIGEVFVDKAIVGAGGLTLEHGVTDYHMEEAATRRAMIQKAREVIVVADSSKFGVTALAAVMPVTAIDHLVTDAGAPPEVLRELEKAGVRVTVVPVPGRDADDAEP